MSVATAAEWLPAGELPDGFEVLLPADEPLDPVGAPDLAAEIADFGDRLALPGRVKKRGEMSNPVASRTDPQARLKRFEARTEWPLAMAAALFLVAYSVEVLARPSQPWRAAIDLGLWVIWGIFAVDYFARFLLATHRVRWFGRHLFDIVIVVLPILRPLRLLRLVIVVSTLEKVIGGAVRGRVVVYTAASAVLLLYAGSLAALQAEQGHSGKINNFGDAVWWSICTVTTVGYGDESPVTTQGRLVAVLLMIGGIGLVSTVTATLASWVVQRVAQEDSEHQAATAAQMQALHDGIRAQMEVLSGEIRQLERIVGSQRSAPETHNGPALDAGPVPRKSPIN